MRSRLSQDAEPIDVRRVEEQLPAVALEYHPRLPSTNDRAIELMGEGQVATPRLIVAEIQTAGRGSRERRWWSVDGSLTFSLIVGQEARPLVDPSHRPKLSLTAGAAICRALAGLIETEHVAFKWPNDVMLCGRKLAGILIEAPAANSPSLVIGVGINVGNSLAAAPEDIQRTAISLADRYPQPVERTAVLIHCVRELLDALGNFAANAELWCARWNALCCLTGRRIQIERGGERICGHCEGIAENGALRINTGARVVECLYGTVVEG